MAVAFQTGEKFKFPDDDRIYSFISFGCTGGEPIIYYEDSGMIRNKLGYYLSDLERPDA